MNGLTSGNAITLLETGEQFFPALEVAINAATKTVFLESYIFRPDVIGQKIAEALKKAAKRGVAVYVIVDGFGGRDFVQTLFSDLLDHGVHALIYRREVRRLSMNRQRLRRLHRKLAVIDGRYAFVGGINIVDDYNSGALKAPRYDYAVMIEGPLLGPISTSVYSLWALVSWLSFRRLPSQWQKKEIHVAPAGDLRAAFLVRDNLFHRHDIEEAYLTAINRAEREVVIACAYFFPGRRFRQALMAAADRGVKVVLLLQGLSDQPLLAHATRALYPLYLSHRIRLFEYQLSYLHAKVAVIDQQWATVGSSNIDAFSLFLAREANVVIDDADFAVQLRTRLYKTMKKGARELKRSDWQRLPRVKRAISWLAYQIVRFAIGLAGFGQEHDE